ncbi:hypothetical protein AB0B10_25865 [Micromonospora arborensis]|uniref:hypothetical protein n=1 Tax=Micromonospora arborensis TaxID=2116518 RepID=UPI0033EC4701
MAHGDGVESYGCRWGNAWQDEITLGDAAEEMEFDLFAGDDLQLVLVKSAVAVADLPIYGLEELRDNDAEDRTGRLDDGLLSGGEFVPPVVVLPGEGLRDGHHRAALAYEAGRASVPAYVARCQVASGG